MPVRSSCRGLDGVPKLGGSPSRRERVDLPLRSVKVGFKYRHVLEQLFLDSAIAYHV